MTDTEGNPSAVGLFSWFVFIQRAFGTTGRSNACGYNNCKLWNPVYRILFGHWQWEDEASPGTALANFINGTWTMVGSGADQMCSSTIPIRWNGITDYMPWITEITGLTENADYS